MPCSTEVSRVRDELVLLEAVLSRRKIWNTAASRSQLPWAVSVRLFHVEGVCAKLRTKPPRPALDAGLQDLAAKDAQPVITGAGFLLE